MIFPTVFKIRNQIKKMDESALPVPGSETLAPPVPGPKASRSLLDVIRKACNRPMSLGKLAHGPWKILDVQENEKILYLQDMFTDRELKYRVIVPKVSGSWTSYDMLLWTGREIVPIPRTASLTSESRS